MNARRALAAATAVLLLMAPAALAQADAPATDAAPTGRHDADTAAEATSTPDAVADLLAGLAGHPGRRAADALAEAAALRLDAVYQPLSLALRFEAQRLTVDPAEEPLPPPFDELFAVDASTESLSATLLLRPFVAGDLADLADQRRADAERAALQAREARAQLDVQTVQSALGLWLATLAVELAEQGEALATAAASATERRADVGGASALELGEADRAVREATAGLRDARAQRDLAGARLATLVPDGTPLAPFALDPVVGVPPDLIRASLDVALAEVGVRSAERGLLPTFEAGYTWLPDDGGSVTLSIESRSWQPAVTYQTAGGGAAGNALGGALPGTAQPTVRGALNVGVAWTISPQGALEADAVRRQLDAAVAGLASAHDRARLGQRSLEAALTGAADREALARLDLALRTLERDAADARFGAGTIGELERLQAHLAWRRAAFALASARVDTLNATLDTYRTYALPLSEVLP